jgi:hypothetical protein
MTRRALLVTWLLLSACDDAPARVPLPCDVRTRVCQRSVFEATAETRQQRGARPPPVRIITRTQLAEEYRDQLERAADEPENENDVALRQMQEGLSLFGLVPTEQSFEEAFVDQAVESIAAYYSSYSKSITIIADAAEDEDEATFTLAHEYVHALQDQREGLGVLRDRFVTGTDDDAALNALIEGEATWLSVVTYRRAVRGEQPADIDATTIFANSLEATLEDIESAPAPLINAGELLPYALGGAGVARRYLDRGVSAVEALYTAPPRTLLAWVDAPAVRRVDLEALPEALDCDTPTAPDGYEITLEDRLGLSGLLALGVALGATAEQAYEAGAGWRADLVTGYASAEQPEAVAIAWRVRLQSASAAQELALAVNESSSERRATALESEVLISAASDPALLESWPDATECPERERSQRRKARSALASLHARFGIVR